MKENEISKKEDFWVSENHVSLLGFMVLVWRVEKIEKTMDT